MEGVCSLCRVPDRGTTRTFPHVHCPDHGDQQGGSGLVCRACAEKWRCGQCGGGADLWYALSLELDTHGIPLVHPLRPDETPPPGTMRYNRFGDMADIQQRYVAFRFNSVVKQGKDPAQDSYLRDYAPPELLLIKTTGFAKAPDSMKQAVIDTFAPPKIAPRPVRVMSWNLQDLGGGPSRGPSRSSESIARIATVIAEVRPDICAILEVKLAGRRPSAPEKPAPPKMTRSRTNAMQLDAEYQARIQIYNKDWAAYQLKLLEWQKAATLGVAPGVVELGRILTALQAIDSAGSWTLLIDDKLHTVGEAYAFFYRADAVRATSWEVLSKWEWPTSGYRHPARVTFELFGRCSRPGLVVDTPFELDVIAFHAPAPDHGEDVFSALKRFADISWPRETVFAGDFNIDTEHGDPSHIKEYPDELDPYDTDFDDAFDQWADLAFNIRLDKAREAFEDMFGGKLTGALKTVFGTGLWLPGVDLDRTSLRTSIGPAKQEHWQDGQWRSTLAFQNAAYDKIMLLTPAGLDLRLLQAANGYAYPLFQRFLPVTLHKHFQTFASPNEGRDSLVVMPASGSVDVAVQSVLTAVKDVSDHVPVVLELEVHPRL